MGLVCVAWTASSVNPRGLEMLLQSCVEPWKVYRNQSLSKNVIQSPGQGEFLPRRKLASPTAVGLQGRWVSTVNRFTEDHRYVSRFFRPDLYSQDLPVNRGHGGADAEGPTHHSSRRPVSWSRPARCRIYPHTSTGPCCRGTAWLCNSPPRYTEGRMLLREEKVQFEPSVHR